MKALVLNIDVELLQGNGKQAEPAKGKPPESGCDVLNTKFFTGTFLPGVPECSAVQDPVSSAWHSLALFLIFIAFWRGKSNSYSEFLLLHADYAFLSARLWGSQLEEDSKDLFVPPVPKAESLKCTSFRKFCVWKFCNVVIIFLKWSMVVKLFFLFQKSFQLVKWDFSLSLFLQAFFFATVSCFAYA